MFFDPDSAQPNQCISALHRNKKKFSPGYEVYDGAKKGDGKGGGDLSIGLQSYEVAFKTAKIP